MKIKKIMLGALAAATIATGIGVSNTPVFAAEPSNVAVTYAHSYETPAFPDQSKAEQANFEHSGLTYAYDSTSDTYYALASSNASTVKDLFLPSHMFDKVVDYSNLSLSNYTAVENVLINANDPNAMYGYLTDLTGNFDLYLNGQVKFNAYIKDLNINNLYIVCPYYANSETLTDENIGQLNGSKINNIYAYRFSGINYWAYNVSKFENANITNIDGKALVPQNIAEVDLAYPLETFYPYEGYKMTPNYLGATGYNQVDDLTNDGLLKDKIKPFIRSLDAKVKTLYLESDIDYQDLPYNMENIVLVVPNYNGQSFMNHKGGEIVIVNNYEEDSINMTYLSYFKTIRFTNIPESGAGGVVWRGMGSNSNYTVNIEKVLLPESHAESHYDPLYGNDVLGPKIETYDDNAYVIPTRSAFLSDDGTIYEVEDQSLELSYLETSIYAMTLAGHAPNTDTPVDVQIAEYLASIPETPDTGDQGNTGGSDTNGEIVFEDESEWTTGVQTIGTLMYASDKDLEDIVRLASNFMVWEDGELADPTGYDIICNVKGQRLSITLKHNGTIVKSVNIYIEQIDQTYGEFIYVELFGTGRGVLLTDIDDSRTTNINTLYDYVMDNAVNASEFNDVEIEEFDFGQEHLATVDSYYKHAVAEKYFQTSTMIINQDFSLLEDTTNLDLTTTGIINPDDEIEDAESEYDVKYIETIYVPSTMNAKTIPHLIKDLIVSKDGDVISGCEVSVSYNGTLTNQEDYSFRMYVSLPDGCRYEKEVQVKVLKDSSTVGYVMFDDGSIIAVTHCNNEHTASSIKTQIEKFLTNTLSMSNPNVVLPEDTNLVSTKTYTGFTYGDEKELSVINSGVGALNFSSADRPVDLSGLKEGYNAMTNLYFTDNYNVNDVVKAIGNKLLLKEGVQVTADYRVESIVYQNTIHWTFYLGETKVHSCQTSYEIIKDSTVGNFIYADAFQFHTGILLLEEGNTNAFADVYNQVIKSCKTTLEEPTTDATLDLSKTGSTMVREVHKLGDFNYYEFETTVYVVDIQDEIQDSSTEIVTPGSGNQGDSGNQGNQGNTGDNGSISDKVDEVKDKLEDWLEDFKAKVEENKALKAATIAFGCITGILLIYGIYVIFKKLFRWLGR